MAGTKAGAKKASNTMRKRYGDDYYHRIGKVGGQNGRTGGFYANREVARNAGAKGGRISNRAGVKNKNKRPLWALLINWRRIVKEYISKHAYGITYDVIDTAYGKGVGVDDLSDAHIAAEYSAGDLADLYLDKIIEEVDTTYGAYEPSEYVSSNLYNILADALLNYITDEKQSDLYWQAYKEFKEVQERDDG